jgi:hypothetical protein
MRRLQCRHNVELTVRRFHEEHVQHRLRDTAETGTTLDNTCLDLTFTRNISVECLNNISYFS